MEGRREGGRKNWKECVNISVVAHHPGTSGQDV